MWFEQTYRLDKPVLRFAHFTDSHLFATPDGLHCGVNSADNLRATLAHMHSQAIDFAIFGGDLTQDHSIESYQLFATLIAQSPLQCPVFWLPGNHDELTQFAQINNTHILPHKHISSPYADILLLNSKGATPAGWVSDEHLKQIQQCQLATNSVKIALCHHQPLSVQGYIDKHTLENGTVLLNTLREKRINVLLHGHVHNEYQQWYKKMHILATPATSVQFPKYSFTRSHHNQGAAYRLCEINQHQWHSEVKWLNR